MSRRIEGDKDEGKDEKVSGMGRKLKNGYCLCTRTRRYYWCLEGVVIRESGGVVVGKNGGKVR